jgi:glycosyltransferase involved in cell wall biosynthesis
MAEEAVSGFVFSPPMLRPGDRLPGISAFMRIRNGADYLEAAIRSHIAHFDEIVAVHNQCTDDTPRILARLAAEFSPRIRVYHYLDPVFPPGSDGHRDTPPDSPSSLVNYYNFALAMTRHSIVTKLDDDHIAMEERVAAMARKVREGAWGAEMSCFSGLNLSQDSSGRIGVLKGEPLAGTGDHGFIPVTPQTYFVHDRRFERLQRGGLKRRFRGFAYWHLKYLKPDLGFGNYDLAANPSSRYARRLERLSERHVVQPSQVARLAGRTEAVAALLRRAGLPLPDKLALRADRLNALKREGGALARELAAVMPLLDWT